MSSPVQVGQTPINNIRISPGDPPISMPSPAQSFVFAVLHVDRTPNGGLNSLTHADSLSASIDYSVDGGITWKTVAQPVWPGGIWTTVNPRTGAVTQQNDEWVSINNGDRGFLTTDLFRVSTVATSAVRISGTLTYFA